MKIIKTWLKTEIEIDVHEIKQLEVDINPKYNLENWICNFLKSKFK